MNIKPIELFQPSVPSLSSYLPYLAEIDSNRTYSNFGPLYERFRGRLGEHFKTTSNQIELFSSGTLALQACLFVLKNPNRPYCILPSWTFVATAQAVLAAGLTPVFVDVDRESMQLDEHSIQSVPDEILKETSVIMVVSPFGSPLRLQGLKHVANQWGIELLADCAAGFDTVTDLSVHSVISLHATKTFGIGEGGLLLSPSAELITQARAFSNFGFLGQRKALHPGINGKLSEMHCAVGLAALDSWSGVRAQYFTQAALYRRHLANSGIQFQAGWGERWISSNCVIRFKSPELKALASAALTAQAIQSRDWWNQGCHREPAFAHYPCYGDLNHTHELAQTSLGIPFFKDLTEEKITRIAKVLGQLN